MFKWMFELFIDAQSPKGIKRLNDFVKILYVAWAWLANAKGLSCHIKKPTLAKVLTEKTSKSAKHACHYATKKTC